MEVAEVIPNTIYEETIFPATAFLGDEEIDLDESMLMDEEYLCSECKQIGDCRINAVGFSPSSIISSVVTTNPKLFLVIHDEMRKISFY